MTATIDRAGIQGRSKIVYGYWHDKKKTLDTGVDLYFECKIFDTPGVSNPQTSLWYAITVKYN